MQNEAPSNINDFAFLIVHHSLDYDARERKRLGIGPNTERVEPFDRATLDALGVSFDQLIPLIETNYKRNGRTVRFVYSEAPIQQPLSE